MKRALVLVLLATSCTHRSAPTEQPPTLRLPDTVRPVRYAPMLTVVPTDDRFTGTIDIDVEVRSPVRTVWLNAQDLRVSRAEARRGDQVLAARVVSQPRDFVGIAFDEPLAAGPAVLHLEYSGVISARDSSGVFKAKEGGDWYVATQFEPLDARRAYPCFDEPGYKVPWTLTLRIKTGQHAFSNAAVASEEAGPDGFTTVRFAPTRPLPSYLTAFVVGPWERLDAGKAGARSTPVGIVVPRTLVAQARWAVESSASIVNRLEGYFGQPYPYEKLDLVAMPLMAGAMENAGLVLFAMPLLTVRPDAETPSFRRHQTEVAVHELAHMWFGDLVTMAWWDDLWLNEAFATWLTPRIVGELQPGWGADLQRVGQRGRAFEADSLLSARRIRQPIASDDDVLNAFDGITYQKGASVIHMFEQWVGPEAFQRGVQRYMKEHAYGNATAAEFLGAISAEAGRDVQPAFSTFLDQGGVPLVTAKLVCERGKAPRLELGQERYLPLGVQPTAAQRDQLWKVPVCVRWAGGERVCSLLDSRSASVPLEAKRCPSGLVVNADAAGYYHSAPPLELLAGGARQLAETERLGALQDAVALARAGKLDYGDLLRVVPTAARDPRRQVVERGIAVAQGLDERQLVPAVANTTYEAWVRSSFGARAHALGWAPKPHESEDDTLLRASLLDLLGFAGADVDVTSDARRLALAWLRDKSAVDAEVAPVALALAARYGDQLLFESYLGTVRREQDRHDRQALLAALASFSDPVLVEKALALTLSDDLPIRESMTIVSEASRIPENRLIAYQFVRDHFDQLVARLPEDRAASLVRVVATLCDERDLPDAEAFFGKRIPELPGGRRAWAQALESVRTCVAVREAQQPAVASFFGFGSGSAAGAPATSPAATGGKPPATHANQSANP